MKEEYVKEIPIRADRSSIMNLLTDAHLFVGISGHISIYKIFDTTLNDFVPQADANNPGDKYKIAFLYQDESGILYCLNGVLQGPQVNSNTVAYSGHTDDEQLSLEINFDVKDDNVIGKMSIEYSSGFFDLFKRKSFNKKAKWYGNMAEHILVKHYSWYLSKLGPSINNNLVEISKASGDVNELIAKLRGLMKFNNTFFVLKGDDFKMVGKISNGDIVNAKLTISGKVYVYREAIAKLFALTGNAELKVYRMSSDDAIMAVLENMEQ
ncbi:hypothetical protein SUSAZ_10070 [Sulfolobus acidocaldarius SUSAZ]|nr:hypothetical protein SUSAZ_10070 [Sulfolobus acidocaldarius SUSAZ]